MHRRGRDESRSEAAADYERQYWPQSQRKELSRTPSTACISSFSGVHPEDGIGKVIIWGDYSVAAAPRKDMSSPRGCAISGLHKKVDLVRQKPVEAVGRGHSSREAARPGCTTFPPSHPVHHSTEHILICALFSRPSSPAR